MGRVRGGQTGIESPEGKEEEVKEKKKKKRGKLGQRKIDIVYILGIYE